MHDNKHIFVCQHCKARIDKRISRHVLIYNCDTKAYLCTVRKMTIGERWEYYTLNPFKKIGWIRRLLSSKEQRFWFFIILVNVICLIINAWRR